MGKFIDLTGERFGRLTVLRRAETKKNATMWECKCDCGNIVTVMANNLRKGATKSCGCYSKEVTGKLTKTHGMTETRLYSLWCGIKRRCYNKNDASYKEYGGRGIKMCEEWENRFEPFCEWSLKTGYSDDLTIDRIDVNGDYEPSNCRWATHEEQANNRRNSLNITLNGITKTVAEWCKHYGINYGTAISRMKRGCSGEELFAPTRRAFYGNQKGVNTETSMCVEINGETKPIMEWCRHFGIAKSTVRKRIDKGWAVEDWFIPPSNKKYKDRTQSEPKGSFLLGA